MILLAVIHTVGLGGGVTTSNALQTGNANVVPLASSHMQFDVANFAFTGHSLTNRVQTISITFTLSDGDTGIMDVDHNSIEITLDGVRTGIFANGFQNKSIREITFTSSLSIALGQMLTTQFADGSATLGLIDHSANLVDQWYNGNYISVVRKNKLPNSNVSTDVFAKLAFSQVPEPSTFSALVGFMVLTSIARYRFRASGKFVS